MNSADLCELQELPVSVAEKKELDARWERFERDPSRALTLEQFRALIEAKRGLTEGCA
jgi:putative addiction module component (TIGR02574 family)